MRALSQLNLLNKKMSGRIAKRSVLDRLMDSLLETTHAKLSIEVPYYDLLRGKVFIADLEKLLNKKLDYPIEKLFTLLYEDFLVQIRRGADLRQMGTWLMKLKDKYIVPKFEEVSEMVQNNDYSFSFVHTEKPIKKKRENEPVIISITILEEEVERGECFLYDMSNLVEDFELSLEELISIRYQDFMKEVKAGNEKVIKAVLSNFNRIDK